MERYESWINRAKSSYELSIVPVTPNMYYEDLCYQAQQAVEKAIKSLLIFYNIEPEFTHNIGILLNELEKVTDVPENVREATELTIYAVQTRYPGEYDEITKMEYEKSIKTAKNCLDWVENKIKKPKENEK
jgi:HEPN domain-containing protein